MVSIVVPVLNEQSEIPSLISNLTGLDGNFEVILVDGGSSDGTRGLLERAAENDGRLRFIAREDSRGRASQMNLGAEKAAGEVLVFLHADCRLHQSSVRKITDAVRQKNVVGGGFKKKYNRESFLLSIYRMVVNLIRTSLLRNFVGTNAIFVRKDVFKRIGGYPVVPILEDVMLSDRLKSEGKLAVLQPPVTASSRRYQASGNFFRMWISFKIILMYRLGIADSKALSQMYADAVKKDRNREIE